LRSLVESSAIGGGVETSISEVKRRFHAKCRSSKPSVRAFLFMRAAVLYNLSQYVDNRLEERLYAEDVEWSGEELLHAVREVLADGVPNWGDAFDPEEARGSAYASRSARCER